MSSSDHPNSFIINSPGVKLHRPFGNHPLCRQPSKLQLSLGFSTKSAVLLACDISACVRSNRMSPGSRDSFSSTTNATLAIWAKPKFVSSFLIGGRQKHHRLYANSRAERVTLFVS